MKPLDSFFRLAHDKEAVKAIFDHVRNLGIVAVVMGAAFWKTGLMKQGQSTMYDGAFVLLLWPLAIFLFLLNLAHGADALRVAKAPSWAILVLTALYTVAASGIASSVLFGRPG